MKINNKKELDFEAKLWQAADKMRNNMDAAEYKHVVLGLIFLKYISDAFNELYQKLAKTKGADAEDPDEYRAENVFYVPKKARWDYLQKNAKQPTIGKLIDDAMDEIEKDNVTLKGVLPKNYARPALDKQRLGELIDLIGTIGLGDKENRSKDILGRVYEYFLGQFANAEGKKGGQFYTPRCVVRLLVEMIEPYKGRVFDPCCGSGGMFVQSEKFVQIHGGRIGDIAIYGQESNQTTWRLCKMNLAIRGIDANISWNNEGSFHNDGHKDLKADFVLANPPFNDSDWRGDLLKEDCRWKYGVPPTSNANFGWMQHIIYHLSPSGTAGIVLADSSMTTTSSDEANIRKKIVEDRLVDCMISLPSHLFSNTQITACLWFLARNKRNGKLRNRENEVLFIDASRMGVLKTRKHRILTDSDINTIASIYHSWKIPKGSYKDVKGICRSVKYDEIRENGFNLAPNIYVKTKTHEINVDFKPSDSDLWKYYEDLRIKLANGLSDLGKTPHAKIKLNKVWEVFRYSQAINKFTLNLYESLINDYFIVHQGESRGKKIPNGWEARKFGDMFEERKYTVKEHGSCPPIYSVTNSGIQQREDKFSKELSKSSEGYKIAFFGDMVFGLSREIPNLDVFVDTAGAFSPAYFVFKPNDARIGLIVGYIMRLKLMEQTDLLKGGAREGRGLDRGRLLKKEFILPNMKTLDEFFENINTEAMSKDHFEVFKDTK